MNRTVSFENEIVPLNGRIVNSVVDKIGKLISVWNMPLFSMSAMDTDLRDPSNYGTLVRVATPADRFATAILTFCYRNEVRALLFFCYFFDLKQLDLPN